MPDMSAMQQRMQQLMDRQRHALEHYNSRHGQGQGRLQHGGGARSEALPAPPPPAAVVPPQHQAFDDHHQPYGQAPALEAPYYPAAPATPAAAAGSGAHLAAVPAAAAAAAAAGPALLGGTSREPRSSLPDYVAKQRQGLGRTTVSSPAPSTSMHLP